jgi:hypothetical protein
VTNDELCSLIDQEVSQSVGYFSGKLSEQRAEAMRYYLGETFGNEQEGRSSVVSRDVADTVEWIMPALMKIFTSGDEIVKFEPNGPEDEEGAQQATDYVNYVFTRQNNGFVALYSFFKDALLLKNGFVKTYWEKYSKRRIEKYENLTLDELTQMVMQLEAQGSQVTVKAGSEDQATGIISVELEIVDEGGRVCVDPVPPDEVLVSKNATWDIQKARFVAHRCRKTASELREMGFDTEGLSTADAEDFGIERQTRLLYDQEDSFENDDMGDESQRVFLVTEAYPLVDFDGDGISERRIVIKVGNEILSNEEIDRVPLDTITPIMMPHKLYGLSVHDIIGDVQLIKSTVLRQILDNMYLTNNSRVMALDGMVNIDDLLTVRPGGVVRVKTFDALKPLTVPFFGAPAFNMLGYLDSVREGRTGVRYFQGVDADALNKDTSGVALDSFKMAAMEKIELIARIFADTGVKSMFMAIFELVSKHEKRAKMIRLRNQWVPIDPRTWSNHFDLSVSVGLGTGNKAQFLNGATTLFNVQKEIIAGGGLNRIVTEENVYNLANDVAQAVFPKKGQKYFTDPSKLPPPEQKPDPKIEMMREKAQIADKTKRDVKMVDFMTEMTRMAKEPPPPAAPPVPPDPSIEAWAGRKHDFEMEKMRMEHERDMKREEMAHETQDSESKNADAADAKKVAENSDRLLQMQESQSQMMEQILRVLSAPKRLILDDKGEPIGVEPVLTETPQAEEERA